MKQYRPVSGSRTASLRLLLLGTLLLCFSAAQAQDSDSDGILDDGDSSTVVGDNPCTGGNTVACDDNCIVDPNPGQEDLDGDQIGDICDPETLITGSASISSPSAFLDLRIAVGGTLTADATVTVGGDLIVEGSVTHTEGNEDGLFLDVTGTLEILSSGALDVSGKGLDVGETYDPLTGSVILSGTNSAGGSHAGRGSQHLQNYCVDPDLWGSEAAEPYGNFEAPDKLGGGGGTGRGGGRIHVSAADVVVDGLISADGDGAFSGGAGGSVHIEITGSASGSGNVQANGGSGAGGGCSIGGAGAGGRIAITGGTISLVGTQIQARGGSSTAPSYAAAGTVFLNDSVGGGELFVENGGVVPDYATPTRTGNDTTLVALVALSVEGGASVDSVTGLAATDIDLRSDGRLSLLSGSTLSVTNVTVDDGADLDTYIDLDITDADGGVTNDVTGDICVQGGGAFHVRAGTTLVPNFDACGSCAAGSCRFVSTSTVHVDITDADGDGVAEAEGILDVASGTITVGDGVTLVKDGDLGVTDHVTSLTVESGGNVTHRGRYLAGLVLDADTIVVEQGGTIDVSEKGLGGAGNGSPFGRGEVYDPSCTNPLDPSCVIEAPSESYGAGHGGTGSGSAESSLYGKLEDADYIGSGGSKGCAFSGRGGGRVWIQAGTLNLGGEIRANGGDAGTGIGCSGSGGSGGSVRLEVGSLGCDGVDCGQVLARSSGGSRAGGGGRVAVYHDSPPTFPDTNFSASTAAGGGFGSSQSSAGTIYLKNNTTGFDELIIDNDLVDAEDTVLDHHLTDEILFDRITVRESGRLRIDGVFTVEQPIVLASGGLLELGPDTSSSLTVNNAVGPDVDIVSGTLLRLHTGSTFGADDVLVSGGVLGIWSDYAPPTFEMTAGTVNVNGGATFTLTDFEPTTIVQSGTVFIDELSELAVLSDSVTVGSGVELIKDGLLTNGVDPTDGIGSMTIEPDGYVQHTPGSLAGLSLTVDTTLLVDGWILAKGDGLSAGETYSVSGLCEQPAGGTTAYSTSGGAGGSYGGYGGVADFDDLDSPRPYGLLENPNHLGSGGTGAAGGAGGGLIRIRAGDITNNGVINATGEDGGSFGSGGSGGGIRIEVDDLPGTGLTGSGVLRARGGDGYRRGGGGRIAVYGPFDTNMSVLADGRDNTGTSSPTNSAPGTIYLQPSSTTPGNLILDNNGGITAGNATPLCTTLTEFGTITVRDGARLLVDTTVLPDPNIIAENLIVDQIGGLHPQWRDLEGARFTLSGQLSVTGSSGFGFRGRGLLGGGSTRSGYVGTDGGETYDSAFAIVEGSADGSGGTHGGLGGGGASNPTYDVDIPESPRHLGSGGARTPLSDGEGGAGGSELWIYAPTCHFETGTTIRASGADATAGSGDQGGGAGGSIKLDCETVSGGGTFEAEGGAGTGTNGNGGGGGRIALRTNDNQLTSDFETVLCVVTGGAGTGSGLGGADGTCFLGDLVPPRVTALSITPGSTLMDFTDTLVATFSENLYEGPGGIDGSHVLLQGAVTGAHGPATPTFNNLNQELTITYPYTLPDDDYTLTLISGEQDAGFSDLSINALDGDDDSDAGPDYVATFTINAPPKVILSHPVPNQLGVAQAANVNLVFSERVAPASVDATTVRLLDAGVAVPSTLAIGPSGRYVRIDPVAPLDLNKLYTVEVSSGVTDLTAQAALPWASLFRTTTLAVGPLTLPSVSDEVPGLAALSGLGSVIRGTGDLDGDDIEDWLVGAPAYDAPSGVEAGAVAVYLGSSLLAERIAPDIIFEGVSAHDRTGVDVDGGFDADADGVPDLLFGAEMVNRTIVTDPACSGGAAPPAPCGAGKAYLIYFDPADYPNLGNPAVTDVVDLADVTGSIDGLVFNGETLGDQTGFTVRGGTILGEEGNDILGEEGNDILGEEGNDILGEEGNDIVIGGPGVDNPTGPAVDAGAIYVVNDVSNLSGAIDLDRVANGLGDQIAGFVVRGDAAGDAFGFEVEILRRGLLTPPPGPKSAGAPSSRGGAIPTEYTLVVGAPLVDYPSLPNAGAIYVHDAGDDLDGDDFIVCSAIDNDEAIQIRGTQADELLGWSVDAAGDNRVDGVGDLLGGAPGYDVDILTDAGRVIHTSTTFVAGSILDADDIGSTHDGVIWVGAGAGDALGTAVDGAGDVTGDGLDDVLLGAPLADPVIDSITVTDAGTVYLVEGEIPLVGTEGVVSVAEVGVSVPGDVLVGTQVGEEAGSSVAGLGDIDDNGDTDAAVGAPQFDNGGDLDAGLVYLLLDTEPVVVAGSCDANGCLVTDPATGALLDVPAGALGGPVSIGLAGIVDEGGAAPPNGGASGLAAPVPIDGERYASFARGRPVFEGGGVSGLPSGPPAGTMLFGGVELTPDGQTFGPPLPSVYVPVRDEAQGQLSGGESFDLYYYDTGGGSWLDSGTDVTIVDNPIAPGKWTGSAQIDPLRTYAIFPADGDGDEVHDGGDNCPVTANAAQENADADSAGDVCDNCVVVYNPSQADADSNTVGDACEALPALHVSSEPADQPDYGAIQAAVDAAVQSGTTIDIVAGNGYAENVVIDEGLALSIVGDDSGGPVVVSGSGIDPAFDVLSTSGGGVVRIERLTIQGEIGVRASVSTLLRDLTFASIAGVAIDLDGGSHTIDEISMDASVADGIDLVAGASLTLRRSILLGLIGTGMNVSGSARVENLLLAQTGDGIVVGATGNLDLVSSTVADGSGVGLDATAGGTAAAEETILYGNALGDLAGVACGNVTGSLLGDTDCTSVNGNLQANPMFDLDYRLLAASPAIDAGPAPASFDGTPCFDLAGGVRLRDGDGDALATIDVGAYEFVPAPAPVGVIGDLAWVDELTMTWTADGGAVEYHVYRDALSSLDYGNFGICRDDLDAVRTDLSLTDVGDPTPGTGWFYRITGEASGGVEGTLGFSACAERSNFTPCP